MQRVLFLEKLEAVAAEAQRQLSLHRNCGCDDHTHHHRLSGVGGVSGGNGAGSGVSGGSQAGVDRRKNRPKTASSPTQTDQVRGLFKNYYDKIRHIQFQILFRKLFLQKEQSI